MFSILSSSQPGRRCLGLCPGFAEITSCPAYVTSTWPQSFPNNFLHIRFFFSFFLGFPGGSDGKASACNTGDPGSTSESGRSPGERNGNPLQNSCLENPMDREAW